MTRVHCITLSTDKHPLPSGRGAVVPEAGIGVVGSAATEIEGLGTDAAALGAGIGVVGLRAIGADGFGAGTVEIGEFDVAIALLAGFDGNDVEGGG